MALIAMFFRLIFGLIMFSIMISLFFAFAMPMMALVVVMVALGILLFPLKILFG